MSKSLSIVVMLFALLLMVAPTKAWAQAQTMKACEVESPPGNCSSQNMWAVEVTVPVPNGAYVHVPDPGCMNDATGQISQVLQGAIAAGNPSLALFSGSIASVLAGPVGDYLKNQGGDIGRYFSPYAKNGALCAPLIAIVPAIGRVIGYRFLAAETSGPFAVCSAGEDCILGWCKFQTEPIVQESPAMTAITAVFMNWSSDRSRRARMIVFYTLPEGRVPITVM